MVRLGNAVLLGFIGFFFLWAALGMLLKFSGSLTAASAIFGVCVAIVAYLVLDLGN